MSPVRQNTGWYWTYLEHPRLQPGYYLLVKHYDCNDVGVVGEAELSPERGVLVVTLGMYVGWLLADVATAPPTDLSAASVC